MFSGPLYQRIHIHMSQRRLQVSTCLAVMTTLIVWSLPVPAQMQVRVEPVILAPIIEELPLSGSVLSPRSSMLAPQESGLVQRMKVDAGDRVEAGDLLLELDAELTRLELRRLETMHEEAQLMYQDAKRLADEGRRLIGDKNISKSQFDSRLATEAAEEKQLSQLDLQIQMQRVRLERHTLRAPFAGVIGFKNTEVGQWLGAGSEAFQLVQLDPLRVQARVPERYFGEVGPGTRVSILVDAFPGDEIVASVDSVVAVSDVSTRSFVARMDIPNTTYRLAPGMSARLVFSLGGAHSKPVLQVPADAIVRRADGSVVVWVVRNDTAQSVPVAMGRRNNSHVEVSSDELREGDLTVTLGNESLRAGQNITAVRG
jgi:RND family efflux transporter MFP subunit